MANKMVANIKSLSEGVTGLTKHVNELYAALAKVNIVATMAMKDTTRALNTVGGSMNLGKSSTRPGTGADGASFAQGSGRSGGNFMANSMAKFSSFAQTPGGMGTLAVAQGALSIGAGAYAATPDLSLTMQRSVGYYQAALKSPGISRGQLERASMKAMGGGLSSVGSDAIASALLAGRGYTPGSKNYLQAMGEVGGAYKYLGMDNGAAASAIAGMHSGSMGANLFQYGITTTGPGGKDKTTGQIASELMKVMTGGAKVSAEDVRKSYQKGALGANLSTMGFDAAQQEMMYQAMIDLASGKNPDLTKAKPSKGNANTMLTASGRLATSQTELMTKAETSMIKGFENAADTVEAFNRALSKVIQPLGQLKGYVGGVGGSNAGGGIGTAAGGIWGMVKKAVGIAIIGAAATGEIGSGGLGTPLALGAAAFGANLVRGGGTSGYGSSFGRAKGGASPAGGAPVTAGYGATDNSGLWAATNNQHKGIDYAMPVGTPVTAALGGTVSQVDLNADYGTSIMVDNTDGTQAVYAHLSEKTVKVGDKVNQGQTIGKSGQSGNANGPHLHFEMRNGKNNPVDPNTLLKGNGSTAQLLNMDFISVNPTAANLIGAGTSTSDTTSSSGTAPTGAANPSGPGANAWAEAFLTAAGAPITKDNVYALTEWMAFESGRKGDPTKYNNPLNTTLDMPGATSRNDKGVKIYTDPSQGIAATLATLQGNRSKERGYAAILEGFKTGATYQQSFDNIKASAWVQGEKGLSPYGFNYSKGPSGGSSSGFGGTGLGGPTSGSVINNTFNMPISLQNGNDEELMRVAKKLKSLMQNSAELSMMGSA